MTKPRGQIYIDKSATDAIMRGKSLLPVGIIEVKGTFEPPIEGFDIKQKTKYDERKINC